MGMVQLLFYNTRSAIEIAQQLADMLQNMPVEGWEREIASNFFLFYPITTKKLQILIPLNT